MGQYDPIDTTKPTASTENPEIAFHFKVDDHGQNDFTYVEVNMYNETTSATVINMVILTAPVSAFYYTHTIDHYNNDFHIVFRAYDDRGNAGPPLEHRWRLEKVLRFMNGEPIMFQKGEKITYA